MVESNTNIDLEIEDEDTLEVNVNAKINSTNDSNNKWNLEDQKGPTFEEESNDFAGDDVTVSFHFLY